MLNKFVPEKVKAFDKKNFVSIEGGQHHTVAMDGDGKLFQQIKFPKSKRESGPDRSVSSNLFLLVTLNGLVMRARESIL